MVLIFNPWSKVTLELSIIRSMAKKSMSKLLESVDQRTDLAGQNRLELLLFKLNDKQTFGLNVFKIREVVHHLPLNILPYQHHCVVGVSHVRQQTIPIIDLSLAIGYDPHPDPQNAIVIITEYNKSIQGFLISKVHKIINMFWSDMKPPPIGVTAGGKNSYLTATTDIENELVEILDVEQIIENVCPIDLVITTDFEFYTRQLELVKHQSVLVVDDSQIARNQVVSSISQIGLDTVIFKTGLEAYEYLIGLIDKGVDPCEKIFMVISDVEMPEMDGYTLCSKCRAHPLLKNMFIVLHTSLSGAFNANLVSKVGADMFIPKFNPDDLIGAALTRFKN